MKKIFHRYNIFVLDHAVLSQTSENSSFSIIERKPPRKTLEDTTIQSHQIWKIKGYSDL